MLFNSYEFLLIFLPIVFATYFSLNRYFGYASGKLFLLFASVVFYCYWVSEYLFLLAFSVLFNFYVGKYLGSAAGKKRRKAMLVFGITINLALLAFFKYFNFFIENVNTVSGADYTLWNIVLPIGISFITFQVIGYLVDAYYGKAKEISLVNYGLFVTFFPQLIAGPIVHHSEVLPQFSRDQNSRIDYQNLSRGMLLMMFGIVKKVLIADTFADWANKGFDFTETLNFFEAWITSLSYTFQLYYDFSGYSDMAVGLALMFNIVIPINFHTPYKASSISDFWRRWHITLSRFLRDYIYIPLGGNKVPLHRNLYNLIIVFLIGGIWHGAAWTFVFWGLLHGGGSAFERLFRSTGIKIPKWLGWLLTFNFVNLAWIFFRAKSWEDGLKVLRGMLGMEGVVLPKILSSIPYLTTADFISFGEWNSQLWERTFYSSRILFFLVVFGTLSIKFKNSHELILGSKLSTGLVAVVFILFLYCLLLLSSNPQFLYFNF